MECIGPIAILLIVVGQIIVQYRKQQQEALRRRAAMPEPQPGRGPAAPPARRIEVEEAEEDLEEEYADEEEPWRPTREEVAEAFRQEALREAARREVAIPVTRPVARQPAPASPFRRPEAVVPIPAARRRRAPVLRGRSLRDAIVLTEILGPPVAMRPPRGEV